MSNNVLTKDAERLLVLMYKAYLQRRKDGASKLDAKNMGSLSMICEEIVTDESPDDVLETCRELSRAGYLKTFWASGRLLRSHLEDAAVVYMENRFKNGLADLATFLANFIP